jgi:hypothetical protein
MDLEQDEVIARLVPDPAGPPDVVALAGFLGRSHRAGFWRLYRTPDLKDFVEIAEDDIVHSEPLGNNSQPLAGTLVWVAKGAEIKRTRSGTAQAEFLQGDITSGYLAQARAEGGFPGRAGGGVLGYRWPTVFDACPSVVNACTWGPRCRTWMMCGAD